MKNAYKNKIGKGIIMYREDNEDSLDKRINKYKMYNNELGNLSDEEKIERIKNEKDESKIFLIIINIENDDLKIKLIEHLTRETYRREVIKSIKDERKKVEALWFLRDLSSIAKIIKTFQDDKLKLVALVYLNYDNWKEEIVQTIQDDELKIESLKYIFKDEYKIHIIMSLKNDEKKIIALDYLEEEFFEAKVIESLKNEKKKIDLLDAIISEMLKTRIIKSIQDEDLKIQALSHLNKEAYKVEVIETIQNEEKKVELLKEIIDDEFKARIIISLQDEDRKISLLSNVVSEYFRAKIVESLHDDEKKKELLKNFQNDEHKANIIKSLQNDDMKIELLHQINDDVNKAKVIITILDKKKRMSLAMGLDDRGKRLVIVFSNDDQEIIELIKSMSDESLKESAITRLIYDDILKLELLKYLNDEFSKAKIICTLQDEKKIIDALKYLKDDFAKIKVIMEIDDAHLRIMALNDLKDTFAKAFVETLINGKYNRKSLTNRSVLKKYCLNQDIKYTQIGIDKNMTIGVEIESEGEMCEYLFDIEKLAIVLQNKEKRSWKSETDSSLSKGVEVISPILTDKKEDIEDIYMVCSFLKKCGQKISERCGGHVHIGADYLTSKEAYVNLFEIWGNAEEIIYIISNGKNIIPRMSINDYAAPISETISKEIENGTINIENEEELEEFIKDIKGTQKDDRYVGLNLLNINNGKNTIEFRIPNGTINPDTWIENIRLFGRIIQISQKLAEIEKQTEHSEEEVRLLNLKSKLKEEISDQEKMEVLLELLFTEEERKVYRERYISNTRIIDQLPDDENPLNGMRFSKVNFKKKKHSIDDFRDVAVNERMENIVREIEEVGTEVKAEQTNENNLKEK